MSIANDVLRPLRIPNELHYTIINRTKPIPRQYCWYNEIRDVQCNYVVETKHEEYLFRLIELMKADGFVQLPCNEEFDLDKYKEIVFSSYKEDRRLEEVFDNTKNFGGYKAYIILDDYGDSVALIMKCDFDDSCFLQIVSQRADCFDFIDIYNDGSKTTEYRQGSFLALVQMYTAAKEKNYAQFLPRQIVPIVKAEYDHRHARDAAARF